MESRERHVVATRSSRGELSIVNVVMGNGRYSQSE